MVEALRAYSPKVSSSSLFDSDSDAAGDRERSRTRCFGLGADLARFWAGGAFDTPFGAGGGLLVALIRGFFTGAWVC